MIKVYVAGPYSGQLMDSLGYMRNGMRVCTELLLAGFAPFCPWLDFHYFLMLRGEELLTKEDFQNYSLAWLEASDIIYVLNGWENSEGTKRELAVALDNKLPVFYQKHMSVQALKEYWKDVV